MSDIILQLSSQQAEAPVVVALSSTLVMGLGASVLSSQNERLDVNLSRKQRLLQLQESDLSRNLHEANTQCVELERSLNLSKHRLLKLQEELAKVRADNAKALEDSARQHKSDLSD